MFGGEPGCPPLGLGCMVELEDETFPDGLVIGDEALAF